MNKIVMAPLNKTVDSKFQVGDINLEVVTQIAESVQSLRDNGVCGLINVPHARLVDGVYEMAEGRHRRAAFAHLAEGDAFFETIPLIVGAMTDQEMYDILIVENWRRRDLPDLEKAELMYGWMTEFKKNSKETGERFSMSDSGVRNLVRLLNLPPEALKQLRSGEINITTARALLLVGRLEGETAIDAVLQEIKENTDQNQTSVDIIDTQLRTSDNVKYLNDRDLREAEPAAFMKHLAVLSAADLKSVVRKAVPESMDRLLSYVTGGMEITYDAFPLEMDDIERVRVLVNPPACEKCPLHAVLDGSHYCGLPVCLTRKQAAWRLHEIDLVSTETGIALYAKSDGGYVALNPYEAADKKLVDERHADLRLIPAQNNWNNFKGIDNTNLKVVAVGMVASKRNQKKAKEKEKGELEKPKPREDYELHSRLRDLAGTWASRFIWEVAAPSFSVVMDGVTNENVLKAIGNSFNFSIPAKKESSGKKADVLRFQRRCVAFSLLTREYGRDWNDMKPVGKIAKTCAKLATDWKVKLPKDWPVQVKKWERDHETAYKDVVLKRKTELAKKDSNE